MLHHAAVVLCCWAVADAAIYRHHSSTNLPQFLSQLREGVLYMTSSLLSAIMTWCSSGTNKGTHLTASIRLY